MTGLTGVTGPILGQSSLEFKVNFSVSKSLKYEIYITAKNGNGIETTSQII